jgi:hypothetical protein
MSDEVPATAGGAVKAYLYAIGFVAVLIGGDMMAERDGLRFGPGLALLVGGLPIFLAAFLWNWIQKKIGKRAAAIAIAYSKDPRWWAMTFFALLVTFGSRFVGPDWIMIGGTIIIVFLFFASPPRIQNEKVEEAPGLQIRDGQMRFDILRLLDFGVSETTFWMLDNLIDLSESPSVTDGFKNGVDKEEAHQSRNFYIGFVRKQLDAGTPRHSEFLNVMQDAEIDAELHLKSIPQDQWPSGIDPITLRKYKISDVQFRRTVQFLRKEKKETKDRLISMRHSLIERSQAQNIPKG